MEKTYDEEHLKAASQLFFFSRDSRDSLHWQVVCDDVKSVKERLETNSSGVNSVNYKGYTPVMLARSVKMLHLLSEYGANFALTTWVDNIERDPLIELCSSDNPALLRKFLVTLLLRYGYTVPKCLEMMNRTVNDETVLIKAASRGYVGVVEFLLKFGVDPSIQIPSTGETAEIAVQSELGGFSDALSDEERLEQRRQFDALSDEEEQEQRRQEAKLREVLAILVEYRERATPNAMDCAEHVSLKPC